MKSNSFKFISIGLIVAFLSSIVVSCGGHDDGGSSYNSPPPSSTAVVVGTISREEIGGTNLVVKSAHQPTDSIITNGTFTTTVSTNGTQLLIIKDLSNELRGFSLSVVDPASGQASIQNIDATSTALSLLFLTPGITTVDIAETQATIAALKNLVSFQQFVNFLKINLPQSSLSGLMGSSAAQTLLINCVNEYISTAGAAKTAYTQRAANAVITPSPSDGSFVIDSIDSTNEQSTKIELANYGLRYVNVYKRFLDEYSKEIQPIAVVEKPMNGRTGVSWGSIFSKTINKPTLKDDMVDFSDDSGSNTVQYWIVGPGWGKSFANLPSTISDDGTDTWGQTVLFYAVFPVVDIVTGSGDALKNAGRINDIWKAISTGKYLNDIDKAKSAGDSFGKQVAILDLTVSFLTSPEVLAAIGEATGLASLAELAPVFAVVSAGFSIGNVVAVVNELSQLPPIAMVYVNKVANNPPSVSFSSLACGRINYPIGTDEILTRCGYPTAYGGYWDDGMLDSNLASFIETNLASDAAFINLVQNNQNGSVYIYLNNNSVTIESTAPPGDTFTLTANVTDKHFTLYAGPQPVCGGELLNY